MFLCYNFAAMEWLLILAIIIPLAAQPTEPPQNKRTSETNNTESAANTKNTGSHQTQSAQTAPPPAQTPIPAEANGNPSTASHHTDANSQQTAEEDRATQQKLTWFTGVLAGVGVLQLVVMSLTWLVYRRQAHEMRRQRHEMRRQRHVMYRQWKAMGEQAKLMENQLAEMKGSGEQTKQLTLHAGSQVSALLASATAMQKSITFQQATLEQWVDVLNWRTSVIPGNNGALPVQLRIQVDVVNPTNFPLTLEDGYIVFASDLRFFFRDHCLLTPRNPYTVDVAIRLPEEFWKRYWQGQGIWIRVEGELAHIGSLRELRPQPFCGHLVCTHKRPARFESETLEAGNSGNQQS